MSGLIPYVVLAGVAIGFFLVCYAVFNKNENFESLEPTNKQNDHRTLYEQEKVHIAPKYKEPSKSNITTESNHVEDADTVADTSVTTELLDCDTVTADGGDSQCITVEQGAVEDTIALGESVDVLEATREISLESTQMIGAEGVEVSKPQGPSMLEETRLFNAAEIDAELMQSVVEDEEPVTGQWAQAAQEDKRVAMAVEPFIQAFGVIRGDSLHYVEEITREALAALGILKLSEVNALLHNIIIQEALMAMQKAYAATPTDWMKMAALESFLDVVQSPKSSTPYLVAFDALRVLPHLTLGHFQVMALTLMLQYSRNSNNYGRIHFKHYVEKYIEPFISDLPLDHSFYRQLEYLRCTQSEREQVTLTQLLSNSYPFVFNFRGFTKEELFRVTDGRGVDSRFVVRSLNSNLYKLAMVDESLAPRFFRETRISDAVVQRDLLALMKSKPTAFRGVEAREIMDNISPVLSDLADVYDTSPMSRISLTLLGLYLGRAHVKATIGEEFDLSRWF